jgi:hypothetical protein
MYHSHMKHSLLLTILIVFQATVLPSCSDYLGGDIYQQVADDAIKQYEMVKRSGSAIDAYVRASLVAEAYLQAGDEANYSKWKAIERKEAARAGMPTY